MGHVTLPVSSSLSFTITQQGLDADDLSLMDRAFKRYQSLCFPPPPFRSSTLYRSDIFAARVNGTNPTLAARPLFATENTLTQVSVTIRTAGRVELTMDASEYYELAIDSHVNPPTATIFADTIWGALRGLESFSQLVVQKTPSVYTIANTPLRMKDTPRFKWRGLMIDSARHYLPMHTIRKGIDGMAYNKVSQSICIYISIVHLGINLISVVWYAWYR